MERGENFTKPGIDKPVKADVRQFLEQRFDWIALVSITLIVLIILVFF